MERRPLRLRTAFTVETGELNDVERAILDLEKQKRALEVALWRDTQELRGTVVTEHQEADETKRRMSYLTGGQLWRNVSPARLCASATCAGSSSRLLALRPSVFGWPT